MAHDPLFHKIPVGSQYLLIFRVKGDEIVEMEEKDFGNFYKEDCFLLVCCTDRLNTNGKAYSGMPVVELSDPGHERIHYWIGSHASLKEALTAERKAGELDRFLGGKAVQHRELEGYESKSFLSYFSDGIRIFNGRFESGFHRMATPPSRPALFVVKGKKRPILYELTTIGWLSMTNSDCYILLTSSVIFVWFGAKSNRMEQLATLHMADSLSQELTPVANLSVVELIDGNEPEQLKPEDYSIFDRYLPLGKKEALHIDVVPNWSVHHEDFGKHEKEFVQLYRCQRNNENKFEVKFVKDGPLTRADLDSKDVFIVDNHSSGIWVWVGNQAPEEERSVALKYAMELIDSKKYESQTEVAKVLEDRETVEFKALFQIWAIDSTEQRAHARLFRMKQDGTFEQVMQFDARDLEEDNIMILDAVDRIFVWFGRDMQKVEKRLEGLYADYIALSYAQLYLKQDQSGRQINSNQIELVKQDKESKEFLEYFREIPA